MAMRISLVGCILVVLFVATSPVVAAPVPAPLAPSDAQIGSPGSVDPFDGARRATERLSFAGVVDVSWDDARGAHTEQLDVRAAGGSVEVDGESTMMSKPDGATAVQRPKGGWDLLSTGASMSTARPGLDDKYDLAPVVQPQPTIVASRPTNLVEVRQAGTVRERLFVDADNGLLLRREQLDLSGHPIHVVAFSSINLDPRIAVPSLPPRLSDHAPDHLSSVSDPAALPGGYRRVDAYRETDHAVHVVYSDGLYDLSVFEQRGALRTRDLPPAGTRVKIGSDKGWVYSWPGGQVLVWHRGHTVYSVVSEAPVDQLVVAARALPPAGGSSIFTRLRRVARSLVQPLAR